MDFFLKLYIQYSRECSIIYLYLLPEIMKWNGMKKCMLLMKEQWVANFEEKIKYRFRNQSFEFV